MTVMRYDSTDEMFGTKRNFANPNKEQKIAIGSEAEEEDEDEDEDEDNDRDDDETSRSRPLLAHHFKACRWNSCKLLELNNGLYESDDRRSNNCDHSNEEQFRLKDWHMHDCDRARQASRSLGDFLAFNSQQKQQYQMEHRHDKSDKHCKRRYKNDESEEQFKNNKQRDCFHLEIDHKRKQQEEEQRQQVKGIGERESNLNLPAVQASQREFYWPSNLSKQEGICTQSSNDLIVPNKRRSRYTARLTANRAQRRRRRGLSSGVASKIITPANLSLSSPLLLQYEEKQQPKEPLSRLPDILRSSRKADSKLEVGVKVEVKDGAEVEAISKSQCLQALSTSDNKGFMGQLDALAGQPVAQVNDVHACETKAVKDNGHANAETNRFHCFVGVASGCCFETSQACRNNGKTDQQQRQVSARLQGCTTNGGSSCSCYSNNCNESRNGVRLSGNRFDRCCSRQDNNDATSATSSPNQLRRAKLDGNSRPTGNEQQQADFDGRRGVGGAIVDGDKLPSIGDQSELMLSIMPDICYPESTTATTSVGPIDSTLLTIIQDKQQKESFHYQVAKSEKREAKVGEKRVEAKRNGYFDSNEYYQRKQQQQQRHNINFAQDKQQYLNDKNNANATNSDKFMVVDLNNSTSKFMGYNSWPKVLLQPGNSATYKVVKQQQQVTALSGLPTTFSLKNEGETIPQKKQETCVSLSIYQQRQEQRGMCNVNSNKTIARYSRPGRSPVSLQRQTNARLTRHKLKIQQQRQEQLAHLALRERLQISQQNSYSNNRIFGQQSSSLSPETNIFGQSTENTGPRKITLDYRLSSRGSNSSIESSLPNNRINAQQRHTLGNNNLNQSDFSTLQHQHIQVDIPTVVSSRTIEISDNQLACCSRQQQESSIHLNDQQASPSSTGNVIVYNKFNMLRSGSSDYSANQQSQFGGANGGSKRSSSYNKKNGVDTEDAQTICSSNGSTMSLNKPFCKICHVSSTKNGDKLISPCRCSGTMQYIHCGCLLKWLEISNRTNEKPMSCELCAHEYTWHKKFNYREAKLPRCSFRDIICHLIFLAAIGIMFLSALAPILYRKSHDQSAAVSTYTSKLGTTESSLSSTNYKTNNNQIDEQRTIRRHYMPSSSSPTFHQASHNRQSNHLTATGRLANDEKFMLLCAASFFISFFLAIYVQTKARDTLYGLFIKFLAMNQTYYITEYDHGQLNVNTNNNSIANGNNNGNIGTCSANNSDSSSTSGGGDLTNVKQEQRQQSHHHHQQQPQHNYRQQQYNSEESRFDRKSSEKS